LAGCAGTGTEPTPPADQTPPTESEEPVGIAYDASPDAVVVNVSSGDGFVPAEISVDQRPLFRLYGDGTVFMIPANDDQVGSFPRLDRFRLSEEGIQFVLEAIDGAGMLGVAREFGQPAVTDMPTTVLTVRAAGGETTQSAYGLDFTDPAAGLTDAQVNARQALSGLIDELRAIPAAHPELLASEVSTYEPTAGALWIFEREGAGEQPVVEWPLATPLDEAQLDANGNRCLELTGQEIATLEAAAGDGLIGTLWQSDEMVASLGLNLILPGDSGCPAT
jgi:hypothetical protein